MLFSPSTLVALGLALSQTAFGLPAPGTTVNKREVFNLPPSDMFVDCGTGYKWARPEIEAAVQLGINSPDRTIGPFPHNFGNNGGLAFNGACDRRTLKEFPLIAGNKVFNGVGAGEDRVVYSSYDNGSGDGTFCGVMTHRGAADPRAFILCHVVD